MAGTSLPIRRDLTWLAQPFASQVQVKLRIIMKVPAIITQSTRSAGAGCARGMTRLRLWAQEMLSRFPWDQPRGLPTADITQTMASAPNCKHSNAAPRIDIGTVKQKKPGRETPPGH